MINRGNGLLVTAGAGDRTLWACGGDDAASAQSQPSGMARLCEDVRCGAGLTVRTVVADARHPNVEVRGELDLASADLFADVLARHLAAGRRFVRLDLTGPGFLDCAGLNSLGHVPNRFRSERCSLLLTGVGPRVRRLLSLTHVDWALLIAGTAALASAVPAPLELARVNVAPLRAT